ncbi:MAG: hypothetical protein HC881_20170 [Leptolyngbyaceae cyanobacterium SL_7_1]|nr:hypothetical protein [Leptolyngbyaceae cyanobacterium SL_7_1]
MTGLFYPQVLLVEVMLLTLRLFDWESGSFLRISLQQAADNRDYRMWFLGVAIALPLILIFALRETAFEPLVTVEQMKALPEFGWRGRNQYFGVNLFYFLFQGDSSFRFPLLPLIIWSSFRLPFMMQIRSGWSKLIQAEIRVLYQVGLASLIMTVLAHIFLLKLYLPSRYSYPTIRFVMRSPPGLLPLSGCTKPLLG